MNPFACFALATLLLAPLITIHAADEPLNTRSAGGAERVDVTFAADDGVFPNPERGFYFSYMPPGGGRVGQQETMHAPLVTEDMKALRARPEAITLIRDCILISRKFWNAPIPQDYLDRLQRDFDTVRAAGIKSVVRFLYDWGMQNRDPDETVILRHLGELKPLLERNGDVIAWVQAGLFGGTGEGCLSDHGYVYSKHLAAGGDKPQWQGLSDAGRRVLLRELSLIPRDRMMTVRYPRLKWDLCGWDVPSAASQARTGKNAFDGSDAARVGFYDDGFMGDAHHYAMFQANGEADFTAKDSEFVIFEGEISDASSYKLQKGQVTLDMTRYRQTALHINGDGGNKVFSTWKANGDMDTITKRMGYRFRLVRAEFPKALRPGSACEVKIEMANDGFTRTMNPRGVEMILRGPTTYSVHLDDGRGNRLWLPGPGERKTLEIVAGLPDSILPGEYEVLLNLHDPHPSLAGRPEYSIRLANDKVWEAESGFNRLLHKIRIDRNAAGQRYQGASRFAPRPAEPGKQ